MPSTYSPDLRIELIANGEQSGTWGTTTNSNLGTLIEDAISGLAPVGVTSANQPLTAFNGAADEARCAAIELSIGAWGSPSNFAVYVPPVTKLYVVKNTSAYVATVYCSTVLGNTTAAGTGVAIPVGKTVLLRSDGTNIVEQLDYVAGNFGVGGASTFTGAATFGSTVTLNANPTLNLQAATKQYVDSSVASGIPTGVITMWSGSIASIPSGWALCNGSNGTPDLRDRFIVGAGNTYNPGDTGGSANATLVSHTHTASSSVSDPGHFHPVPESTQLLNSGNGFATGVTSTPRTVNSATRTTGITVSTSVSTEGSSATNANLPPYYALAFIMKL